MNTFPIQIRREFWEHRSLWIAPLVWVAVITLLFTYTVVAVIPDRAGHTMTMQLGSQADLSQLSAEDRQKVEEAMKVPDERKQTFYAISYLAITGLIFFFVCIVVFFYLLDCLFAERRDRSILFWKSLPISDTQVVLSKLAVALVVVPLGTIALAAATQLVMFVVVWLKFHGTMVDAVMPDWSLLAWLRSLGLALSITLGAVLWYVPITGYLLLMSSWARRNVFLWAVLPPISLAVLEGFFLHSKNVLDFLGWRFVGHIHLMRVDQSAFQTGVTDHELPRLDQIMNAFDMTRLFASPGLWLGLVAGAAMVYAAIRLRRYRDDS